MKEYNTIFNHTLAPITPGPSSSNTCGPVRIGLVCQQLLGSVPQSAVIEYDKTGAFPNTLYGMKSDIAFLNGLMGKEQNSPDFNNAYENCRLLGSDIHFKEVSDLKTGGMETVRIRMTAKDGSHLTVIGESTGGGAIKIHSIDDCAVDISGTCFETLLFVDKTVKGNDPKALASLLTEKAECFNDCIIVSGNAYSIIDIKTGKHLSDDLLQKIAVDPRIEKIRCVAPLHPVITDVNRKPPFETPNGFIAYCEEHACSPAEASIAYEKALSGWSDAKIRQYADMLLEIMRNSREGGYDHNLKYDGITVPKAASMRGKIGTGRMPSLGLLNDAITAALGIMEHSNATGKIVCVPTGGSSGIVPALLLSAADYLNLTEEELYRGLMTAGMIGVLMMIDGNEFAGGAHGCQAEIACGSAMAAAGLVEMMDGTAKQACDAASMCLQSFLGLICDPVAAGASSLSDTKHCRCLRRSFLRGECLCRF